MSYSFPIGRLIGIPVRIHYTFLILPLTSIWLTLELTGEPRVALWTTAMILLLFSCVVLHELGHCVAARRLGAQVQGITMLPIGGVAWMTHLPERPREEAWVAIAGPLVNVLLLALLLPLTGWQVLLEGWNALPAAAHDLPGALARGNLVLCTFNLIPAFPMDGGRLLRAGLAVFLPFGQATDWAARFGRALALLLIVRGLGGIPLLAVAGTFVFIAAGRESGVVRQREALSGQRVREIMHPAALLSPDQSLLEVLALVHAGSGPDFVVQEDGFAQGLLLRKHWLSALRRGGADRRVRDAMARHFASVPPDADTGRVWFDLHRQAHHLVPVVEQGRLLGVLNLMDLAVRLPVDAPPAAAVTGRHHVQLG